LRRCRRHKDDRTFDDILQLADVSRPRIGGAARKLGQSAARKVIHLKDVHSTPIVLSGLFLVRGPGR
jgi:transcription initiation factor TFIIIB Brf1 subunit/transcription initiation factor TFIIB